MNKSSEQTQETLPTKETLPIKEKSDKSLEISKALIGCTGTVIVAIITGIFALINTLGPRLPLLLGETKAVTPVAPIVIVLLPTPQVVALATAAPSTVVQPNAPRASNVVFGPIVFAPGITGMEPNKNAIDAAVRFPEGTTKVYSVFAYEGTITGSQWRWERSLNGKLQPEFTSVGINLAGQGNTWVVLWQDSGIPPGDWEFRLYVDDRIVQKASFSIDKRPANAAFFGPIRFAEGAKDDKPVNVHKSLENFKAGTKEVYAFFDAGNMTKDLKWKHEWYRDGQLLSSLVKTDAWSGGATEKDWWLKTFNDSGLSSGTYELKLYIEDKLVQLCTFVIE